MRFAQGADFDESEQYKWFATCDASPAQEHMLAMLTSILVQKTHCASPLESC